MRGRLIRGSGGRAPSRRRPTGAGGQSPEANSAEGDQQAEGPSPWQFLKICY